MFLPSAKETVRFLVCLLVVILTSSSGPSKHYIQALETRLLETENALFRALSVLTQQQLPSVPFSQQPQDPPSNSLEPVTDKPYLFRKDKKFGTEYWAQFSLGSEAEIARWFQDHGGVLQQLTSGVNPSAALDLDYGSSHSSNPAVLHDVQTNPRTPDTATALRVEAGYSSPQASEKPNQVDSRKFAHIRNAQAEKVTRRSILHITIDPKSENHSLSLNVGTSSTSKAAPQSQETRLAEEDFLW